MSRSVLPRNWPILSTQSASSQSNESEPPPPPLMEAHHFDSIAGEDDAVDDAFPPPLRPQPRAKPKRDAKNPSTWGKVGRNEPCPCGSGKNYKQCHGMVVA